MPAINRPFKVDRRGFLAGSTASLALAACAQGAPPINPDLLEKVRSLIAARPSFDLHAHPGRTFLRDAKDLSLSLSAISLTGADEEQALADMSAGGMNAAVFCAVSDLQLLALTDQGLMPSREFNDGEAWESYQTQISHLNKIAELGTGKIALSPSDLEAAKTAGLIGIVLGVEGGDFLEGKVERVDQAYADGVRCITPLHYHTNEIGDIMTGSPVHEGLSSAGADIVKAMNEAGIIVDLAHASEASAYGMLELSTQPVICSHTHVRTEELNHPRFISRDLAKAIADAGGVIGAWPAGIGIDSLDGFVDRIFQLVDLVGADHVGLGTDMDANYKPVWDNYDQFPQVVARLIERGMTEQEIAGVIGGNGLRVFSRVAGD